MKLLSRLETAAEAAYRLGVPAILQNSLYRFGLVSGHFRRVTPAVSPADDPQTMDLLRQAAQRPPHAIVSPPESEELRWMLEKGVGQVLDEAREIIEGKVRLFGAEPVPLDLNPHTPPVHWTEAQKLVSGDIKDIWEPVRMGWVFSLGRAYRLTHDERCCQAFWEGFETFQRLNPYNLGPNWASGQEVALRIMALGFGWQIFYDSTLSTPERIYALVCSIYEHACRIPSTMIYARSQKNNHLICEAVGLLTAGWLLPEVSESPDWQKQGWQTLNLALEQQIDEDGIYMQQSINYHRLMLDAALWAHAVEKRMQEEGNLTEITAKYGYTKNSLRKLTAAVDWLAAQVDPVSGLCPNLGANDGAHILPLAGGAYYDYRPVVQAAGLAFGGIEVLPAGPWDEQCLWLGILLPAERKNSDRVRSSGVHRLGDAKSWASLRAVHFHERPSHADQLHVEFWWSGQNIAMDAGTYRYHAASPWDNALAGTAVHNTIMVDGQDQMKRAGRFLWLDWAQARIIQAETPEYDKITAEHNGYKKPGILHQRTLERISALEWLVKDALLPTGRRNDEHCFCLHWLVHDWPFMVDEKNSSIQLETPVGKAVVCMTASAGAESSGAVLGEESSKMNCGNLCIARAGEIVYGTGDARSIHGWWSPAYSKLEPALSILLTIHSIAPLEIQTRWIFSPSVDH